MRVPPLRLLLVAGARPNFMKVAPLIGVIDSLGKKRNLERPVEYFLVHTGQHYDSNMSKVFFEDLGIPPPHINLEVGSDTHASQTARIMMAFEPVCIEQNPDWVVVFGDVNSTMACSLVASKLGIKVAHIEAGLRSYDRSMPEEINRVITDAVSDILFTPSVEAGRNLLQEGISRGRIRYVGNIMIDALVAHLPRLSNSRFANENDWRPGEFAYVTLHRPSNVDHIESFGSTLRALNKLARYLAVIFPVHPRTQNILRNHFSSMNHHPRLHLIQPVGYLDSLWLTQNARFVLTDSGGLQEESTYFRVPCLTLRPNTERPITITKGTNKLTNPDRLTRDIQDILDGKTPKGQIPKYWDGQTAERILKILLSWT